MADKFFVNCKPLHAAVMQSVPISSLNYNFYVCVCAYNSISAHHVPKNPYTQKQKKKKG